MAKTIRQDGHLVFKLENGNTQSRGKFRRLAREVSGEVYEIPDENQVIFAYSSKYGTPLLVGEISFSHADLRQHMPGSNFDSEFYPQISFLFVHRDYQRKGLGKLLLQECVKVIHQHESKNRRPIRLQSAENAVVFFQKGGFYVVGNPVACFQSGSRLFDTLVNMEETLLL